MSFAIIETGGKQYRVSPGTVLSIEKLEIEAGQPVVFERVLMYQVAEEPVIGAPTVANVTVTAEVLAQVKGDKIRVSTFKAKKRQRRTLGHRQQLTQVKITDIVLPAPKKKTKEVA